MSEDKSVPRILQPPAKGDGEAQRQRTDAAEAPSGGQRGGEASGQVEGEGSYTAARDYQKNIKGYMDKADIDANAEAARPRSEAEAREMEQAEREGRSHSRGER